MPARRRQGLHCRLNFQLGKRVCAGIEGDELQQRRYAGARAGDSKRQREGAKRRGRCGGEAARTVGRVAGYGAEVRCSLARGYHRFTRSFESVQPRRKTFGESSAADALPFYQRAIELDPSFPAAYAALGNSYYSLAEEGRAIEYYVKAFQLRAHASEREKLDISGDYYASALGDLNKATEVYLQKVRMYPRDPRGYFNLGGVYSSLGQYEKAIEKYRQSISVSPDRVDAYENLINALLALRRFDEAAQTAEQAQARKLDDTTLHNALYALAFLSGDSSGMEEQQRWYVGRIDENVGLSLQSDTEAYAGHMRKARELTTRAVDSAIRGDSKETAALWQEIAAQREAVSGNTAYATEAAVQGLKLYPASHEVKVEAALALAMAGDLSRAEALVQDLNRQYPHATQIQAIWLPSVQAKLALNRPNPALALSILQADSPIELGTIDFVANLNCLYPKYIRAEAYLAAGQGTRAAAEFQKVVDNSGIVWNCWTGALARLGMARANALQAKNSTGADADAAHVRALVGYKDFLTRWKDADPDIPIYKAAKAEYAKLQ